MDSAARQQEAEEAAAAEEGNGHDDSEAVVRLADYSVGFVSDGGPVTVVDRIDLRVGPGEVLALVGEGGSGKSVFCRSLMGLAGPGSWMEGKARVAGIDLVAARPRAVSRLRGGTAAMVFQGAATGFDPLRTVGAPLITTLRRHHGLNRRQAHARALALLSQVGLPEPERHLSSHPHQLSGGVRQLVMIAVALAGDPALLIADEPTTALGPIVQDQVLQQLRHLVDTRGMALILATHDLAIARRIADRVAVLYAGRLAEVAPATVLFDAPRHRYTRALLAAWPDLRHLRALRTIGGGMPSPRDRPKGCAFVPLCSEADAGCVMEPQALRPVDSVLAACRHPVRPDEGIAPVRDGADAPVARPAALAAQPVLEVEAARRSFRTGHRRLFRPASHLQAVDDVSLAIAPGATLGLVGESGCGKSTLGRLIMGMTRLEAGRVRIGDRTLVARKAPDRRALARRVQMVLQDPTAALDPRLPIVVQVAEPMRVHRLYDGARRRELALGMLRAVGLPPAADTARPAELNGSQAQQAVIARALVLAPLLLICDEATAAMDVSAQAEILHLLQRLQRERGLSLLCISQDLAVLRALASDIAVMQQGRIVEHGPAAQVVEAPRHPYTQALVAAAGALPATPLQGAA